MVPEYADILHSIVLINAPGPLASSGRYLFCLLTHVNAFVVLYERIPPGIVG